MAFCCLLYAREAIAPIGSISRISDHTAGRGSVREGHAEVFVSW